MTKGLTGNQLKLLALITMTVDHVGQVLLPQYPILRIIGRLSFPIYAFMIAEGCRHTRSMPRYLGSVAVLAAVCQVVYWLATGSLYQCILVTFSISIGLLFLLRRAREAGSPWTALALAAAVLALFVTEVLPLLLPDTDFGVDYGFLGVMLPVGICLGRSKAQRLGIAALVLLLMGFTIGAVQWFSLLALPLLALYNGQRGRRDIRNLFYFYYPAHLAVIHGVSMLIK